MDSEESAGLGQTVADALLGAGLSVKRLADRRTRAVVRSIRPVAAVVLRPPLLPEDKWPATVLEAIAQRGRLERIAMERRAIELLQAMAPSVLGLVLDAIDLTAVVVERVDLDAVAARLNFDVIVDRVPISRVIERLDLDAVADRLDLDRAVKRLNLDAVIAMADIDSVVSRVDVEAILARLDLVGIVRGVLDQLDLPEIIRQSSGSIASSGVRGVRVLSFEADQKVSRTVDRLLPHRRPPAL
jgi:hypothetical protein